MRVGGQAYPENGFSVPVLCQLPHSLTNTTSEDLKTLACPIRGASEDAHQNVDNVGLDSLKAIDASLDSPTTTATWGDGAIGIDQSK
jgi:hypothetical protein